MKLLFLLVLGVTSALAQNWSVSFQQFSNALTRNQYRAPSPEQYQNFVNYAKSQGRISSLQEAAMCLAQLIHESGGLQFKRETRCQNTGCPGEYQTSGCDVAGQRYYGRGYIQLTWCYNYKPASQGIFRDDRLVRDPDSVARDDSIAWRTTFWYWSERVRTKDGVLQGRFGASTKAINGGECVSPGNPTAQRRFQLYGNVRAAFGLPGAGDPSGCP